MARQILIIEDDADIAQLLALHLGDLSFKVEVVGNGKEGLAKAKRGTYEMIILDLMLPDVHGFDICQRLRAANILTPILMLTAMDRVEDRIRGLKLGADDYLTKPFDFDELLARIEALVRRSNSFRGDIHILRVGDLVFDREKIEVHRGDERLILSAKELALLELLMSAPGKVFSRTRILNSVWGYDKDPLTNVVDVYIARLRKKLEVDGAQPLIETVRGYGYRIAERS